MTLGLARELATEGIRVNAIRPGLIDTEIHASGGQPDRAARLGVTTPMGRAGQPNEVAPCHLFLACDESSYLSGQVLHPNGSEIVGG